MERVKQGQTAKDEEIFQFWDELRKKGTKDPSKAIEAAKFEFKLEERIAVIYMQRYIKCFGER